MRAWLAILTIGLLVGSAQGELVSKTVEYKDGGTTLEGVVVYDNTWKGKKPGVIVAHETGASSALAKSKAVQVAKLGYVAFSIDLFGKGVLPKDGKEAATKAGLGAKDRKAFRARAAAGFDAFSKLATVDDKRIAGVGYGVGGIALLELARTGADLEGIVLVHAELGASADEQKKIGASILVIVGADDPQIPLAQIGTFEDEMRKGDVDWQTLRLGGVVHDFTNPAAGRNPKSGAAFDADADARANEAIKSFLTECFVPVAGPAAKPPEKKEAPPAPKGIPAKVMTVLKYVDDKGEAIEGYEGGRNFGNFEKRLPQANDRGQRIKYREWDVNPLKPGVNRGAERLVTGNDGSAYYTDDHYATFKKIR